METVIPTLSDIVIRQIIFMERPDVRNQWIGIVFSLTIGWLLSKYGWQQLQLNFPHFTKFNLVKSRLSRQEYGAFLIQTLDFPVLSLILLSLVELLFSSQDWTDGIIRIFIKLITIYTIYRFFLTLLYSIFPVHLIRTYQTRLFAPLILLFSLQQIASMNADLTQVSQIILFKLFGENVTVGAIFWLFTGLYFWIITVTIGEEISRIYFQSQTELEKGKTEAALLLVRYFLMSLGIVIILGSVGVNGTAVAAITGGLSVGIGFGLQQVVSNFVSGILLLFEGVLKPGDIINVEGDTCRVTKLGIRATTVLRLIDNSEKIIPNQTFFTSDLTTYTGSDHLVYCSIAIGVSYGSSVEKAIDLLLKIAKQHPQVLNQPEPVAFFINFGDSSLNVELKFWLNDINSKKRVISDINCTILEVFREHHIEIPFPQRDIHLYHNH
ncbi:MAG: mechanosensitive ion channel domain-containing protein [Snowella sp.]|nr:mechanosensitive ion channel domain-containing protein [Snowella sp.]